MKTYQDLLNLTTEKSKIEFIMDAISEWKATKVYSTAKKAKNYDKGYNETIKFYEKFLYNSAGEKYKDIYASNNKISTTIFHQLITQQNEYSLANGVIFAPDVLSEEQEKKLGSWFDSSIKKLGRYALRDGFSFGYYNGSNIQAFEVLEFVPLYDEETGALASGIRFYQLDTDKPLNVWLYEQDGYTRYRKGKSESKLSVYQEKRKYKEQLSGTVASGFDVVGGENYNSLPIKQMKGNEYGISELLCVIDKIDSFDLTLSGLANDIDENAFVYWILKNSGGIDNRDLARFKQQIRTAKTAVVDTDDGGDVEHFVKDVPTEARNSMLDRLKAEIYEDFGAFNPKTISAGSVTATEITSAYTSADNKASDFEKQITDFVLSILQLLDIQIDFEDVFYKRQKLKNEQEEANTIRTKVETLQLLQNDISAETYLKAIKSIVPELANIDITKEIEKRLNEGMQDSGFAEE